MRMIEQQALLNSWVSYKRQCKASYNATVTATNSLMKRLSMLPVVELEKKDAVVFDFPERIANASIDRDAESRAEKQRPEMR